MDIIIIQQPALLGLDITYPKVEVEQKPAKMALHPSSITVQVKSQQGKIIVDNTEPLKAIGYYGFRLFSQIMAQKSQQTGLAAINRAVEEGFRFADIHLSEDVIAEIAVENAWQKEKQVEVGFKPGPETEFIKGEIDITAKEERVKIDISMGRFNVEGLLGKINIYLLQKPYFATEYIGPRLDLRG